MGLIHASTAALALLAQVGAASPLTARAEASSTILSVPESTSSSAPSFDWSSKWETKYQIHHSCNSTFRNQLEVALDETEQLAKHARDHLLRFGHKSELVQKYFGNGSTAEPIGWFDRVVGADKSSVIFRCDDPDQNCKTQDSKSTLETYTSRSRLHTALANTVSNRMGRPLARQQCYIGDRHL